MAVEVFIYVLGGLILGDREVGKRKKLLFNKPTENLELTICFHRKKWVLHVLKKCLDLCWLCCSQTLPDCTLCSSPAPVSLSWKFAAFTAFTSVLVNGVPMFRFHASALFAQCGGTGHELYRGDLSLGWPLGKSLVKEQLQAAPSFAFLVKLDHCRSISFGIKESWRFLEKLALSHENTTVRDKDKQRAGYQKVM